MSSWERKILLVFFTSKVSMDLYPITLFVGVSAFHFKVKRGNFLCYERNQDLGSQTLLARWVTSIEGRGMICTPFRGSHLHKVGSQNTMMSQCVISWRSFVNSLRKINNVEAREDGQKWQWLFETYCSSPVLGTVGFPKPALSILMLIGQ